MERLMKSDSLIFMAFLLSCQAQADPPQAPKQALTSSPSSASAPASSARPSGAQQALDRLDARAPVPLLPMMANHQKQSMRDHLTAVQQIVAAAASNDFATIEKAAARLG